MPEAQLDAGHWLFSERRTKDGGFVSVGTDITVLGREGDFHRVRFESLDGVLAVRHLPTDAALAERLGVPHIHRHTLHSVPQRETGEQVRGRGRREAEARDLGSQPAMGLRQLAADRTAAQDQEMVGGALAGEDRLVG